MTPQKLTKTFNAINVARGDIFVVELESNPSTGYRWNLTLEQGQARLLREEFSTVSDADGAGGKSLYVFEATAAGQIKLHADYVGFSGDKEDSADFKINVA
jgi:predicted secreted protein